MPNETQETALKVAGRIRPQTNRYYRKISLLYRAMAVVVTVVLVLFCMGVIAVGREYITYDNLVYLMRDFDLTMRGGEKTAAVISYPRHETLRFDGYKSGIAAAGGDVLRIYDSGGILLLEESLQYTTPGMAVSDKYVLTYDLGGKEYAVFNTLTRVIRRDTDFRIQCADISDSGAFVLVTRSNETKYVVELYNAALSHTMSVYKDHYVLDAAIREDGKRVAIVSAVPDQTDFCCEVSLCAEGRGEPVATVSFAGLMPLDATFQPDGSFTVICDSAILFFDKDGSLVSRYNLSGMALVDARAGKGYTALIGAENALGSENRVVVLDTQGQVLLSQMYRERMEAVCITGEDSLCAVLTPGGILLMDENGIQATCQLEDDDILALRQTDMGLMVCTKDSIFPAVFAGDNE